MTGYFALLRLQLLSRYADLKPGNIKAQFAEKGWKAVLRPLGVIVLLIYLGTFLVVIENGIMTRLMAMGLPDMLPNLAVTMGTLGTLIMAFFFVMSALYFNRDAVLMAALPIRTRTLLCARLTQIWLSETGINALILLPAGIIYGVRTGVAATYYLRLAAVWLTLSMLPIAAIALLSTLLIRLSSLWKRRELLATICGLVFLAVYLVFCMNMGYMAGDNENASEMLANLLASQQARIQAMFSFFPPMRWAAAGLLGDGGKLLLFTAVSLAASALVIVVLTTVYRKLSLLQGETSAAVMKRSGKGAGAVRSPLSACCRREWLSILRVPTYAVNLLPTAILPTIMIVALFMGIRKNGQDILETLTGTVSDGVIVAVLAAAMGYMTGINPAASSAVTREGSGHAVLRSLPVGSRTSVLAKLIISYGISLSGTLIATVALAVLAPSLLVHALLAFVLCALYGFATTCLSLARDVRNPRLDWVTEQEAVKQQSGVLIGLLISWGILVALAVASFGLLSLDIGMYLYTAILALPLAVLSWLTYRRLMTTADRYY